MTAATALRRVASRSSRAFLGAFVPARTAAWPEASRLFVVGDEFGWSIDDDAARLSATARRLGYEVAPSAWARHARNQSVFHPDHFGALRPRWLESSHRLGFSYFHGRPGTPDYPEFDDAYETLRRNAALVLRFSMIAAGMATAYQTATSTPGTMKSAKPTPKASSKTIIIQRVRRARPRTSP